MRDLRDGSRETMGGRGINIGLRIQPKAPEAKGHLNV